MRLFLFAVLASLAAPVSAEPLPSGIYDVISDGGEGRVSVVGQLVKITVRNPNCSGSLTGVYSEESDNAWNVDVDSDMGLCTVAFIKQGQSYAIDETNCGYFHGTSCAFAGSMVQTGGSSEPAAMRAAFENFEPNMLKAIQDVFVQLGLYHGGGGGAYGPATAAALAQLP